MKHTILKTGTCYYGGMQPSGMVHMVQHVILCSRHKAMNTDRKKLTTFMNKSFVLGNRWPSTIWPMTMIILNLCKLGTRIEYQQIVNSEFVINRVRKITLLGISYLIYWYPRNTFNYLISTNDLSCSNKVNHLSWINRF